MTSSRRLLQHLVGALAYRTQKALRGAPDGFPDFRAGAGVRTPHELLQHMSSVILYARAALRGAHREPLTPTTFAGEVARFHESLAALRDELAEATPSARITDEQLLQGPLADAMTHAGQLAMLRRLAGSPVAAENFVLADVSAANVSAAQSEPHPPDAAAGGPKHDASAPLR